MLQLEIFCIMCVFLTAFLLILKNYAYLVFFCGNFDLEFDRKLTGISLCSLFLELVLSRQALRFKSRHNSYLFKENKSKKFLLS